MRCMCPRFLGASMRQCLFLLSLSEVCVCACVCVYVYMCVSVCACLLGNICVSPSENKRNWILAETNSVHTLVRWESVV